MARVIYKYDVLITDYQQIQTGANPVVRHFGEQNGLLKVWIEHDTDGQTFLPLVMVGTGHQLPGIEGAFLGTVVAHNGFVWHLFYARK